MNRIFICCLGLLLMSSAYGQRKRGSIAYLDSIAKQQVEILRTQQVDTLFVWARSCEGDVQAFRMKDGKFCSSKDTYIEAAVIYMRGGKPMVTKMDNCGLYKPVALPNKAVIDYYLVNQDELKGSGVKTYEADAVYDTPTARTEVYRCQRNYVFFDDDGEYEFRYKELDLTNDPQYPNKNYTYNNNHPQVKLDALISPLMDQLETQAKFRRQ
ncbi:hypothetical protein [Gilvibacter sp.]|uniref:hypothetical protein n=1 Tax=Gilvibacter sp. TaxID=2729997 RepID=UPI003B52828E